ncbi:MAG: histidinol phosphate phosphatase domain-containing protein [Dehalococcoidia bacterium]|nr:MAG: histidinol phosphate phosphatase domain-containing protein [Dehalococcoidia bacterium]
MIDLHTHSLLSDGELLPAELARRAKAKGYSAIGISDHVDHTNIENVIASILKLSEHIAYQEGITVLPGVEITHVPCKLIKGLIGTARELGIFYVVVHGETIAEPVEEGTNREAIEGRADILAHPGLITEGDVARAKENGVLLEISGRKGHSLTNGHVGKLAGKFGAKLIFNTDSHDPSDLVSKEQAGNIVLGAGLTLDAFHMMQNNAFELLQRATEKRR